MATATRADALHEPPAFAGRVGGWLIGTAIAFLVLGTMAILDPTVAGLIAATLVGWLLIASGFAHGVNAFRSESVTRAAGQVFVGLLYVIAGLYFLAHPLIELRALAVSLACVLFAEAVMDFVAWLGARRDEGSEWLLMNAVTTAALSVLLFLQWPSISIGVIGALLGLNLILSGVSRLMLGAAERSEARRLVVTADVLHRASAMKLHALLKKTATVALVAVLIVGSAPPAFSQAAGGWRHLSRRRSVAAPREREWRDDFHLSAAARDAGTAICSTHTRPSRSRHPERPRPTTA